MLRRCDSVARHASLSLMWRPRPCCFVCQTVRLVSDRSSPIAFPSPYRADGGARPPHQRHPSPAATHDLFARSRRLHHKRTGGKPLGYAAQATGPALAPPPATGIHLYSNKENASHEYAEDRYYGARRLRELWQRLSRDRGVRYYVLGTVLLMVIATAKLWSLQQSLTQVGGLLGPKKKNYRSRLTVVLDVDETIVSYGDKAHRMKAGMVIRPYLAELLDYLAHIDAEVVLWSACSERYMRKVLGVIDPHGIRISHYITRSSSWFTRDSYYEKNLLWLKRPMADTLIIENRALSVRNCNANAVLVEEFIRGEYMDTGQDFPPNDDALRTVRAIIEDLETTGMPVPQYLARATAAEVVGGCSARGGGESAAAAAKTRTSWLGRMRGPRKDAETRRSATNTDEVAFHADVRSIPCHLAIRQLPDELARGVFYFVGNKYKHSSEANMMMG